MRNFFLSVILVVAGCSPSFTSLQKSWPVQNNSGRGHEFYITASVEKGQIFTIKNDTLKGNIKLLPQSPDFYSYILILPENKKDEKDIIKVETRNIQYIIVDHGSFYDTSFTEFMNLDDGYLWRLLAKKDSVSVFDRVDLPSSNYSTLTPYYYSHYGHKMILVKNNTKIILFSSLPAATHKNNIRPLLIKFINKRYSKSYSLKYFKDVPNMFDYILLEENKKVD